MRTGYPHIRFSAHEGLLTLVCLALVAGFGARPAGAQDAPGSISGLVLDAGTGDPLAGVHVFLSSRLQGTTTDADGAFSLEPLAPGSYKVVASIIGYESESKQVDVSPGEEKHVEAFRLKPAVYELAGVQVTEEQPRLWRKQLKRFEAYFLGTSVNARRSTIENDYVLSFQEDEQGFKAFASEPLRIENRGLGYRLTFVLNEFREDLERGLRFTVGTWRFEELEPKNDKEAILWKRQREMTYQGSLQHLLRSMIQMRAEEEGFTLLRDFSEDAEGPELFLNKYYPLDVRTVLRKSDTPYEYKMWFPDFIRVHYLQKLDRVRLFGRRPPEQQLSYLKMTGQDEMTIHESGYMYSPSGETGALTVFGYLASLGVADLLPQEYALQRE